TSSTRPLTGALAGLFGTPVSAFRVKNGTPRGSYVSLARAERFAVPVPLRPGNGNTWSGSVFFDSVPIIYQNNGSQSGHLPSIGAHETQMTIPIPSLKAVHDRNTGRLRDVFSWLDPFPSIAGDERVQGFFSPLSFSSCTEIIQNVAPALENQQIDYTAPSLNSGSDIVWHSKDILGLEPRFKATDPDVADSQSQAAFKSGIAFAVAATAFIALLQELPKEAPGLPAWWPGRKRKRKSPAGSAPAASNGSSQSAPSRPQPTSTGPTESERPSATEPPR